MSTLTGTVELPYRAYFYIGLTSTGTNATMVTVRTIQAEVIDGKEPGVHEGWAMHFRKIPPVRQEEENILEAITAELRRGQRVPGKRV